MDGENLQVLVVDDSPFSRNHIKRTLASLGIRNIDMAEDGVRALEMIEQHFVTVHLPRFSIRTPLQLGVTLQGMGMIDAFDSSLADFTAMGPTRRSIGDVVHQAFIEVSEAGTEAAAATVLTISFLSFGTKAMTAAPMTGKKVIQDRMWSDIEMLLSA